MAYRFKTPADYSVFPISKSKPQPAAFIIEFFYLNIFRFKNAIFQLNPAPFCLLDEVDAPLDDSNIDKFLAMIRDFSKETQFLVVTHNKRTMEAADTMYGITQQDEGISKIVSVRFENEKVKA